jgi:membrane-associated phospholipid phosphatase
MTALDLRTLFFVYGGMHGRWAPAMIAFTVLGAGWAALALVPLLWHVRTRSFGLVLGLAIGLQAILVVSIKAAVGRVRPWIALGLPAPIGEPRDGSFPSGHAAASFCVAVFLVLALRSTTRRSSELTTPPSAGVPSPAVWSGSAVVHRIGAVVALCIAALIALSRVYLGAHFPSDVLGGAVLGALVGALGAAVYAGRVPAPLLRGPLESRAKRR